MLKLKGISKSYGQQTVLQELDLEIAEGERLAILGPSGSGKTTLLNLIGGLDRPDSGGILFRGESLEGKSEQDMDRYRNREVGFVFQFHHLLPQCTLMENVLIPTLVDQETRTSAGERAGELLKRTGIWDHRNKRPGQLSGGECQRAAVVRAMINSPSILLADEPTGALDGQNVDLMADLLLDLNREEQLALVLVTHSTALASRMDRILQLKEGKLVRS